MPTLNVDLTDEQYARFKAALKKVRGMESDPTDDELITALKREASAITYAGEVAQTDLPEWQF